MLYLVCHHCVVAIYQAETPGSYFSIALRPVKQQPVVFLPFAKQGVTSENAGADVVSVLRSVACCCLVRGLQVHNVPNCLKAKLALLQVIILAWQASGLWLRFLY